MRDDYGMRDGDGLFEVGPVGKKRPQSPAEAVGRTFRAFDPHQVLLLPPSLDDWLPEDHLARFVADLVDEVLDLGPVLADYTEKRGCPPYDPRLMVRLLIYGYTTGVRSSRAIERRLADDVAFRFWPPARNRTSARSPGFAAAISMRSPVCSPSRCTSRPSSAWSRWDASRWTARNYNLRKIFQHVGTTGLAGLAG
jgi:hypothetical protein